MPASTTVRLLCPLAFLALLGQSYVQAQDYGNDTTALLASGVVPVAAPAVSEEALLTVIACPLVNGHCCHWILPRSASLQYLLSPSLPNGGRVCQVIYQGTPLIAGSHLSVSSVKVSDVKSQEALKAA